MMHRVSYSLRIWDIQEIPNGLHRKLVLNTKYSWNRRFENQLGSVLASDYLYTVHIIILEFYSFFSKRIFGPIKVLV